MYSLGTTVNSWVWQVGNTLVNQGQTIPALLNISSSGTYTMSASYGNGCESTSSELKIHGHDCEDDAYGLINEVLTKVVNGGAFLEVNSLPKAMYIVKITTDDGKTEYVKLKKE